MKPDVVDFIWVSVSLTCFLKKVVNFAFCKEQLCSFTQDVYTCTHDICCTQFNICAISVLTICEGKDVYVSDSCWTIWNRTTWRYHAWWTFSNSHNDGITWTFLQRTSRSRSVLTVSSSFCLFQAFWLVLQKIHLYENITWKIVAFLTKIQHKMSGQGGGLNGIWW